MDVSRLHYEAALVRLNFFSRLSWVQLVSGDEQTRAGLEYLLWNQLGRRKLRKEFCLPDPRAMALGLTPYLPGLDLALDGLCYHTALAFVGCLQPGDRFDRDSESVALLVLASFAGMVAALLGTFGVPA